MSKFSIFSVMGIEIEYMLVDKDSLNIQPKSDLILESLAGKLVNEVLLGDIAISNEIVMHVLEFKNNGPKPPQTNVIEQFQKTIVDIQPILQQHNLMLLPTGAHPWMNPEQETRRWPHGNDAHYQQFDAIFNCQGHGWSNLQSMHVNLPYSTEQEFGQLHNVIRLILPLIPALAASSPVLDGKSTGLLDARLYYYCHNQDRIPSISGDIIPEFILTETEYQEKILDRMYKDISPLDPKKILQHQWLNSRAAIPKLDHKAIEIRIIDTQECVTADLAIAKAILNILKHWQESSELYLDQPCETKRLRALFDQCISSGLATTVDDRELCNQWQLPSKTRSVREIWSHLIERVSAQLESNEQLALEKILSQGNLSERILKTLGKTINQDSLKQVYGQLAHCLLTNKQFEYTPR